MVPKTLFIGLLTTATLSVEFSFNNTIYRQIDGVAKGSPLGPALPNIFFEYNEKKLLRRNNKPVLYLQFVDDIFAIFNPEFDCDSFLSAVNSFNFYVLTFTFRKEADDTLSFLNVLVETAESELLTSAYRISTSIGQYTRWNLFGPPKPKANHI